MGHLPFVGVPPGVAGMTATVVIAVLGAGVLLATLAVLIKMLLLLDAMRIADEVVATNLAAAQTAVEGVASDLVDSHRRADETIGPHGAAADAASQTAPPPLNPGY